MAAQKIFGSSQNGRFSQKNADPKKPKKKKKGLRALVIILCLVLLAEIGYCLLIFSNIPFMVKMRNMYIETAMSTMSHRWLATYFIPKDIVDEVVQRVQDAREAQMGQTSSWETVPTEGTEPAVSPTEDTGPTLPADEAAFFDLFHEIDEASMRAYLEENPEALEDGWENISIDYSALYEDGTDIYTVQGDQVLALSVPDQVLLVRVTGSTYQGVLAIAKDASRLKVSPSEGIGSYGQFCGTIAENNDGVLAFTGSGFIDEGGGGNGGTLAGAAMCEGESYGNHYGYGYKRIELREDNHLYVTDASDYFHEDTTDAVEFWPALIMDGENALGADHIFTEMNPRACLGQSRNGDILALVIEGRMPGYSLGTDAEECVDILMRYDCYQAMNLDGGTSAIMWYKGKYVTRCSNTALDEGRYLPNAWVYASEPVD